MSDNHEDFIDPDGDGIRLEFTSVSARFSRIGDGPYAGLPREAVARLHAALGEWLFPAYSGAPAASLLEQMVRKAAEDAVSAVLPLAARPGAGYQTVIDPEPRDIGHPEPGPTWDDQLWGSVEGPGRAGPCQELAPRFTRLSDPCQGCGYVWALHRAQPPVCGCIRAADTDTGTQCPRCGHEHWSDTRCMHPREVQAPRRLVGCECGHSWRQHDDAGCTRVHPEGGCTRTPPNAGEVRP